MSDQKAELLAQIKALHVEYQQELPDRLQEITDLWGELSLDWRQELASELYVLLHKMAGSGASFACVELSRVAKLAEKALAPLVRSSQPPKTDKVNQLSILLKELVLCEPAVTQVELSVNRLSEFNDNEPSPLVYLLDDNEDFAASLSLQLQSFGFQVSYFSTITAFQRAVTEKLPNVVIVDIVLSEGDLAGTRFIQQLKAEMDFDVPVIVFSVRSDFEARLDAVKAGATDYLVKPIEIDNLVSSLDRLTHQDLIAEPLKILIVDDDQKLAKHYALVLSRFGMNTVYLTEPEKVCQTIADFIPDLILSDLHMPKCTGLQLASLIRQYSEYVHIPIVFLSTETQISKQLNALRMGGDEFLTKPVDEMYLCQCVQIRALRARSLKELMAQDSLTGLLKHAVIKERLRTEVSRAARKETNLCFVMIDIDHFKAVNDNYGHLMGDRVIKSLARLLRSRFRESDVVGRYGGEEFAIVLPECNLEQAKQHVDAVRHDFETTTYTQDQHEFKVTISAGIAQFPDFKTADALNKAADEALYQAKNNGRNCIELA
jgi:diguanylate cyclase (GGDEF)-like protein